MTCGVSINHLTLNENDIGSYRTFLKVRPPLRREDDLICRGGLEEYRVANERGTQREVPNAGGHFGKTMDVRPPDDWMPNFVAPAVYQPLREQAREGMRAILFRLME